MSKTILALGLALSFFSLPVLAQDKPAGQHADPAREDQGGQETSGGGEHGIDGLTWLKYCSADIGAVIVR